MLVHYKIVTIIFLPNINALDYAQTMVYYHIKGVQTVCNNTSINFEQIAKDCGLYDKDVSIVINNIEALEKKYTKEDLVYIYNYMLTFCKNPDIIMYLISCVDKYRSPSSLSVLVDLLLLKNLQVDDENNKEKYIKVRALCAKAIGNQKNTEYVSTLLYCLNNKHENYRVRLACADALGRIGDRFAVAPLINVVEDEDEKSVYLRESAATALGMLGDSRAIEPLVSILETKKGIIDKFSFLKERAIESLNKVGIGSNDRAFKALKKSLSDESVQVRIDAIEALMNSEHPSAYEAIKSVLILDSDEEVKKNALIALYNLSGREILDEVINSPNYSDKLKICAVEIIDEYEEDGEDK